ncbi:MAG: hypothetical protein ACQEVD_09270 [Actinomycetota bacterium]
MEIMDSIARLLDTLAWPATVLILMFGFRNAIKELVSRVSRAAWKDAEVTFSSEVGELARDVEALEDRTPGDGTTTTSDSEVELDDFEKCKSNRLFRMAYELVDEYPMVAVSLGRSAFESSLAESIEGKHEARLTKSLGRTISELEEALGREWSTAARKAVKLGNDAAHGHAEDITPRVGREFLVSAESLSGFAEAVLNVE